MAASRINQSNYNISKTTKKSATKLTTSGSSKPFTVSPSYVCYGFLFSKDGELLIQKFIPFPEAKRMTDAKPSDVTITFLSKVYGVRDTQLIATGNLDSRTTHYIFVHLDDPIEEANSFTF